MTLTDNQKIILRAWIAQASIEDFISLVEMEAPARVALLRDFAVKMQLSVEKDLDAVNKTTADLEAKAAAVAELLP